MPNTVNLYAEQGANMIGDDAQPTLTLSNSLKIILFIRMSSLEIIFTVLSLAIIEAP